MVLDIFRAILRCCFSPSTTASTADEQNGDEEDLLPVYDETMHLIIPETVEVAVGSDETRMYQRRLRERLTEIVRSTEGKMVNLASQLPLNLHNRVLPKSPSHSSSRSTLDVAFLSADEDVYMSYADFYSHQDLVRLRKERSKYYHGLGRLRSLSPELDSVFYHPGTRTRTPSPAEREKAGPVRMLNIRLVGGAETRTRGRARERTEYPSGLPGLKREGEVEEGVAGPSLVDTRLANFEVDVPEVDDMILTWD